MLDPNFILEAKRTKFRIYRSDDLDEHVSILANWDVTKWLSNAISFPYTRFDGEKFIKDEAANFIQGKRITFSIIEKKTERHMGGIRLFSSHSESCEVGYWLGPDFWGKGYGSEILAETINFAFGNDVVRQLFALTTAKNVPSQKLLTKMGFIHHGSPPKEHTRCGQTEGCSEYFVLDKQNWIKRI